jgi:biotin carboxyl carrier protein|tara:strand:+ start:2109 stop:2606 length:498 start_codon:yes stop_codon:yes gene_type:complete
MEWSVPDEPERYKASLQEAEGSVSVTSLTRDGTEVHIPETSVEAEGRPGRVMVKVDGVTKLAHIARSGDTWWVHIDGRAHEVAFHEQGSRAPANEGSLKAPMPGTVLQVMAKEGQRVREGQHLMTLEAMKMEHKILAPKPGGITKIHFSEGDRVDMGSSLVEIGD